MKEENKIKEGDVVTLKSDNMPMTVSMTKAGEAVCHWRTKADEMKCDTIPLVALSKVATPNAPAKAIVAPAKAKLGRPPKAKAAPHHIKHGPPTNAVPHYAKPTGCDGTVRHAPKGMVYSVKIPYKGRDFYLGVDGNRKTEHPVAAAFKTEKAANKFATMPGATVVSRKRRA